MEIFLVGECEHVVDPKVVGLIYERGGHLDPKTMVKMPIKPPY